MALFSRKKSYLGIDLGTSSIKLIELTEEAGKPKLVTYGFIEEPTDIVKNDSEEAKRRIILLLKELIKKTGTTCDRVVAALPSFTVFSSIISLPAMSKKDLNSAVRWEAKKFVPMPLEEMVLDWRLLKDLKEGKKDDEAVKNNENEAQEKEGEEDKKKKKKKKESLKQSNYKILLTAAPKNLAKKYIEIFKALNLQIVSLETEAFALERSLIGNDMSPMMIIDIGALAADISVINEGVPVLNRGIDVGGDTITKAISNAMNIDLERAEQFKRDFGVSSSETTQGQIPKTIEFVISSIINEVKHCINLYSNVEETPIEKIILSGGSAFLPNLPEYLSKLFNIKVIIGNPWSRVSFPKELEPALLEIGPRFSVAIGLAMREII